MEFRLLTQVRLFIRKVYDIKYPKEEIFNLESQLKRASVSIALNIREGNYMTPKNKRRFFNIAKGSAMECDECLLLLESLHDINTEELRVQGLSIIKQLQTLTSNLQSPQ